MMLGIAAFVLFFEFFALFFASIIAWVVVLAQEIEARRTALSQAEREMEGGG